ncbi:MAG: hypothetical protein ACC656_07810 [Candidatus Heimdallarchaeota archaeon]
MFIEISTTNKKHLQGILKYAIQAEPYYKSFTRTKSAKIQHIIIGKIAEYLIYQNFIDKNDNHIFSKPDFKIKKHPDPGWDMIHLKTGKKIDIKKQFDKKHFNFRINKLKADIFGSFSNIVYNQETAEMSGDFEGFVTKTDLQNNLKESTHLYFRKLGYYFYVFRDNLNWQYDIENFLS